jgi:hypothetical protein
MHVRACQSRLHHISISAEGREIEAESNVHNKKEI